MATFAQISGYNSSMPGYIPPSDALDTLEPAEQNVAADNTVIPILYGRQRVQAKIATVAKDLNDNLVVCCIWCLGEVDSIESVLVDSKFTSDYINSSVTTVNYTGTTTQIADPTLVALLPSYTDTLIATNFGYNIGVCYSVITIDKGAVDSFPTFEAIIKGRKVYDPRDGGQVEGTPSTWLYSTNPSLCIADFLKSTEYGWDKTVDYSTVIACADFNDEIIPTTSVKRHEINISIDSVSSTGTTVEALRAYAHCFVVFDGATISLVPDNVISYSPTEINEDTILSLALRKNNITDLPTVYRVEYTNTTIEATTPSGEWKVSEAVEYVAGVEAGTTQRRETVIDMYGYTEYNQALREAIQRINYYDLSDLYVTWRATDEALAYQVGDVVNISHQLGLVSKSFRITEIRPISAGRWNIIGQEYNALVYSDENSTTGVSPGYDTGFDVEAIPGVPGQISVVKTEEVVDDRNLVITVLVSWVENPEPNYVKGYTMAWKIVGETWSYIDVSENSIIVPFWPAQKSMVCKVKAKGAVTDSDYTAEFAFTTNTATSTPSVPLNLRISGGLTEFADDHVVVGWDNNPLNDSNYLKDYLVTVYNTSAELIKEYEIPLEQDPLAANYRGGAALYSREHIVNDFDHPERSFNVEVAARDIIDRVSPTIALLISNPAPAVPVGTVETFENDVVLTLDVASVFPDISNLIVAVSSTAGFDHLDRKYWLAKVPAQRAVLGVKYPNVPTGTLYARFALDDTYSDLDLNWSAEVTVDVTGEKEYPEPGVPTGLGFTKVTNQDANGVNRYNIVGTWVIPAGVAPTGYVLEWAFNATGVVLGEVATTNPTFTFVDVNMDGTVYKARVKAVNGTSESAYSAWVTYTVTADTTPPASCTGLAGAALQGSITLDWVDPADADFNKTSLYNSLINDFSTATKLLTTRFETGQMLTSEDGDTHYFWVVSEDHDGNTGTEHPPALAGVAVVTNSDYGYSIPGVPTGVSAAEEVTVFADGGTQIKLRISWTASTGTVTSYTIRGGEDGQVLGTAESTTTELLSVLLTADRLYHYQVKANHYTSSSAYSTDQTITTLGDVDAPTDPTDLTITGSVGRLIASWTPPPEVDYKHAEIWSSSTNDRATATLFDTNISNRYTLDGVIPGTYYVWIRFSDYVPNLSGWFPALATNGVVGTAT